MKRQRIIIIGPGRMGLGIALAFALHKFEIKILDLKSRLPREYETVEKKAKQELTSDLKLLKRIGYLKGSSERIVSNISFLHGLKEEHLQGDFVFEAIPEKANVKVALFKRISPYLHPETIVASATSTIDLKTLKTGFLNPANLLITHWLNPAFIIPLVEIARAEWTDTETVDRMKDLLKRIGKTPVVLRDSPGFIIPRIQALAMNEAVHILEEGIATAEDIDVAIKYGFGFRLAAFGLLEFVDMGGLDILYYADQFLYSAFKSERFKVPELIEEKMRKGEVGPRTGKGIYDYRDIPVKLLFEDRYRKLVKLLRLLKR